MTINRRNFLQKIAAGAAALAIAGRFDAAAQTTTLPAGMALAISVTIKPPVGNERYHKPYMAVWVETPGGQLVRTVTLWRMQEDKGKNWLKDVRKWFRLVTKPDVVKSSATRGPGEYKVIWDGLDENGKRAAAGEYVVLVEAAREKGPYGRVRLPITLGATAVNAKATGTGDLGDVVAEYRVE